MSKKGIHHGFIPVSTLITRGATSLLVANFCLTPLALPLNQINQAFDKNSTLNYYQQLFSEDLSTQPFSIPDEESTPSVLEESTTVTEPTEIRESTEITETEIVTATTETETPSTPVSPESVLASTAATLPPMLRNATAEVFASRTQIEAFVTRFYQVVLGRNPDTYGLADWSNRLEAKISTGADIVVGFFFSDEYINKKKPDTLFVNDLYSALLNRPSDPHGLNDWTTRLGRGTERIAVLRGFVLSPEFSTLCSNYGITRGDVYIPTPAAQFVRRMYNVVLNRNPDDAGLSNWENALLNKAKTGAELAFGFYFSNEYLNKNKNYNDYIMDLYKSLLDRSPDPAGLRDWVNRLTQGADRQTILKGFIESPEYTSLCARYGIERGTIPEPSMASQFVRRMYFVVLNREPDLAGQRNWEKILLDKNRTGADLALGFVFSDEYKNKKKSDNDYILDLYKAILGRGADAAGLTNWLTQIKYGINRQTILKGFIDSPEFNRLCQSYGITAGTITGMSDAEKFVSRMFYQVFNRLPTAQELDQWSTELTQKRKTASDVVANFFSQNEYLRQNKSHEQFIIDVYKATLDRTPDAAEKGAWLAKIAQGMSRLEILYAFTFSHEFAQLCNNSRIEKGTIVLPSKPELFVIELFNRTLRRQPTIEEKNKWVPELTSKSKVPAELVQYLMISKAYYDFNRYPENIIKDAYSILTRKNTDNYVLNLIGDLTWKKKSISEIIKLFVSSNEFTLYCNYYDLTAGAEKFKLPDYRPSGIILDTNTIWSESIKKFKANGNWFDTKPTSGDMGLLTIRFGQYTTQQEYIDAIFARFKGHKLQRITVESRIYDGEDWLFIEAHYAKTT